MDTGKFVISLDFELMWGVRDKRSITDYGDSILGVRPALNLMLDLFDKYNIKTTFATVGFLFHENRKDLYENIPTLKPSYFDTNLSPYTDLESFLGDDEIVDPYYFGYSLVQEIKNRKAHEIATHTYCHYYCLEPGQTIAQFEEDLKVAVSVAKNNNVTLKSIVFPRNQYNKDYIEVCRKYGITSFRGNEKSRIYESSNGEEQTLNRRALRFLDSYINITGYHCYTQKLMKEYSLVNIPSSRFLRPYSIKLSFLDGLKFLRIKNAMTYAAKNNLMYHLWWHPHNFGRNFVENIKFLEKVLKHYEFLNVKYRFQSTTMSKLSADLNSVK
jgi:peptidoglycan/xylan/chitin deacetylase (PgdA/CDA1 family)